MTTRPMVSGAGPEADQWFVDQGLPWFVPERRQKAHRALHSKHTLAGMVVIAVLALALGVVLAYLTDELSVAPATMVTLIVLATFLYAGRELGAWPIAKWAIGRTMRSLRLLFPMVTRALPLLLLFMTFLFINAEVWQVSATLDGGVLWVTVLLFSFIALAFLLTRLPEELDHVDDEADESSVVEVCRGTPLAAYAQSVLDADDSVERLAERTKVHGLEKANLLLVLIVTQALQVLLLSVSVFAFFVVFGAVIMKHGVQEAWTGSTIHALPYATNLSVELLQVSVFLAAFSGLYFTVYAVTDETYRDQFFTEIKAELEKAVGVRAVYLAARGDVDTSATEPQA
jgi:hypothetical protein